MIRACDWCGAWFDCEKCDDSAVRALMDDPAADDPMDADQGGHLLRAATSMSFIGRMRTLPRPLKVQ
jgi:hypothetical protein